MGNERKGCVIVRSLEPLSCQAVSQRVASRMEDVGTRRFRYATGKTGMYGISHRGLLRMDEVVKCAVLKGLKVTNEERLGQKAVTDRLTRMDREQQAVTACLQRKAKCYGRQASFCSTPVFSERHRGHRKNRAGSTSSGGGECSLEEPERKRKRKKYRV